MVKFVEVNEVVKEFPKADYAEGPMYLNPDQVIAVKEVSPAAVDEGFAPKGARSVVFSHDTDPVGTRPIFTTHPVNELVVMLGTTI